MKNRTIFLVGGGTGGHIVPVFELYRKLCGRDINVKMIGSNSAIDQMIIGKNRDFIRLVTGKLHRNITAKNILEAIKTIYGLFQAFFLLFWFRPVHLFSKGGYVSMPLIFWAKALRIPYSIHESDIEFGSANLFAFTGAKKVFTGFPKECYDSKFHTKIEFCGQFVPDYRHKKTALFENDKPVVLVTGGSQGARFINDMLVQALPSLLTKYNIIHQTGLLDFEKVQSIKDLLSSDQKASYIAKQFFSRGDGSLSIENVFQNSDIFVGRASITTPAEATFFGIPLILIPYPYAANAHQLKNARFLSDRGACIMVDQCNLTPEKLVEKIESLTLNASYKNKLVFNAKNIFKTNALEIVSEYLVSKMECEEV